MRDAAVMLIIKDGLILSISRRNDSTKFGLLGGKLDTNETPEQAAIRETIEEAGVKVSKCDFIFRRDEPRENNNGEDFHVYCFYALEWEGEPIHSSEEGEVKWLTEKDLTTDKGAFADYNRRTLEAFKLKYPNTYIQ